MAALNFAAEKRGEEARKKQVNGALINFQMSTPFYRQALPTSKHPCARAVKQVVRLRTPHSSKIVQTEYKSNLFEFVEV